MDPISVTFNTVFLLPNQGVRVARQINTGQPNFIIRGFVSDTLGRGTEFYAYARALTGSWVLLSPGVLFASQTGVSLTPQQSSATGFNEYAFVPVFPTNALRRLELRQFNFT